MGEKCSLCPRHCLVNRENSVGFCKCSDEMTIARIAPHFGEEPPISGSRGSGTVFFSGCSLGCCYCQNSVISCGPVGKKYSPERLADEIKKLEATGVHNISFVTGSHYAFQIYKAMKLYRPSVPVVWNSSGYETTETVEMLSEFVDIWLPDIKYAIPEKAKRYSNAEDYAQYAFPAVELMLQKNGPLALNNEGIAQKGVLIRHLVLPSNTKNSIAVLEEISKRFGNEVPVSIMNQYVPCGRADLFPEINRKVTRREYDKVCAKALELGINGFTQLSSSATKDWIPDFDTEKV